MQIIIILSQLKYCDQMGQDHPKQNKELANHVLKHANIFARDPRLIEAEVFIPELFEGNINLQIKKIQKLLTSLKKHQLFSPMIDGIHQRFFIKNSNKKLTPKKQSLEFTQLQTLDNFCDFLEKVERWFHIEKQLSQNYAPNRDASSKLTIRKKIVTVYESKIDLLLYSRLFIFYYLLAMKKNMSSKEERRQHKMKEFHYSIGKMILKMIEFNNLNEQETKELAYKIIYIEKVASSEKYESILESLRRQFWPIYLAKEHSIGVPEKEIQKYRQITRCYLSELYLKSIKEAEDPDIKDQNQSLGLIKNFPVNRVKDKNKLL